jgi:hypothetical protein
LFAPMSDRTEGFYHEILCNCFPLLPKRHKKKMKILSEIC